MSIIWATHSGFLSNGELNMQFQMSAQPLLRFRNFVSIKEAFGKNKGESVNWLKVADLGTIGGRVNETNTMPKSSQSLSWGTLSVDEYGNSLPYTFRAESLSEFDVMEIIEKGLRNDMVKVLDGLVEIQMRETPLYYVGTSTTGSALTTNSTATASNTSILNTFHVRKMILELRKRRVPGFTRAGGDYVGLLSTEAMENIVGALESVNQYVESGHTKIQDGEAGRYFNTRFIEDQFATRYTYDPDARTSTLRTWAQSQSLDSYFFGDGNVREAVVEPEHIRGKIATDYGRDMGLAWLFLGGHQIEWSDEPNARIIRWATAG